MKNYIATIQELLKGRDEGFDAAKKVRLVRHTWPKPELDIWGKTFRGSVLDLYRYDYASFLDWQSSQSESKFKDVDYIVVFIGERSTTSRFVGVYKNNGCDSSIVDAHGGVKFYFEEVPGFELLKERVIIDWGKATTAWAQDWKNEKSVIRIDANPFDENNVPNFTSYANVILSFNDMKRIFETNDVIWKNVLTAVNCIYLIQDCKTGKQYVGSTYGTAGIWGRWSQYVATNGHGDDVELKRLVDADPDYASNNFQWVILETLPSNITEEDAIGRENLYKQKFMTRKFGYNKN